MCGVFCTFSLNFSLFRSFFFFFFFPSFPPAIHNVSFAAFSKGKGKLYWFYSNVFALMTKQKKRRQKKHRHCPLQVARLSMHVYKEKITKKNIGCIFFLRVFLCFKLHFFLCLHQRQFCFVCFCFCFCTPSSSLYFPHSFHVKVYCFFFLFFFFFWGSISSLFFPFVIFFEGEKKLNVYFFFSRFSFFHFSFFCQKVVIKSKKESLCSHLRKGLLYLALQKNQR